MLKEEEKKQNEKKARHYHLPRKPQKKPHNLKKS